jgi:hypothetical protein
LADIASPNKAHEIDGTIISSTASLNVVRIRPYSGGGSGAPVTAAIFRGDQSSEFMGNATFNGNVTATGTGNHQFGTGTAYSILANGAIINYIGNGGRFSIAEKWGMYKNNDDTNLYFRDMENARMQMVFLPGANANAANTSIQSQLEVYRSLTLGADSAGGERITFQGVIPAYRTIIENNYDSNRSFAITAGGFDVIKCTQDVYSSLTLGHAGTQDVVFSGLKATFNGSATFGGTVSSDAFRHRNSAGEFPWMLYSPGTDMSWYVRDMVNARMQMTFNPGASASAALTQIHSQLTVEGAATLSGIAKLGDFTVGTLPSAVANAGYECNVTDSSVTTFGSTVAGGGSSRVKLYSNGTNWTVQAV